MRAVVDNNIFVSAALKQRSLPNLALYQASQRCVLLKSIVTEAQFFEVIARPYLAPLIRQETRDWLTQLMRSAELVSITERIAVCRDPTDDKFLELAVDGHGENAGNTNTDALTEPAA
jgi:putative PIN family toxin of toxin-antitoxin system